MTLEKCIKIYLKTFMIIARIFHSFQLFFSNIYRLCFIGKLLQAKLNGDKFEFNMKQKS